MQENRNQTCGSPLDSRGTVCIDTKRVLDCCRDRDCFEDTRVYLSNYGEEILGCATNVRTKSAKILWAYVGVQPVAFNDGFYKITVRYYILVEIEACVGVCKSQTFKGLATVEKDVILYGGEGNITTYCSTPENDYCCIGNTQTVTTNIPEACVETVEPVVLSTKIKDCPCDCDKHCCCDCSDLPDCVRTCLDGEICKECKGPALYISFGIFSVIRIERPAQILVQGTDYSVPDKECVAGTDNTGDDPCELFKTVPFPINRFSPTENSRPNCQRPQGNCGCGCNKK